MNKNKAITLAYSLMREHGLIQQGWTFRLDRAKKRFGCTNYARQTISLSRYLVELNNIDQVRDTILHEIAHAIAGRGTGHGPQWRQIAACIGANPKRCYSPKEIVTPEREWIGTCPSCGNTVQRHRLTKRARYGACSRCCNRYNGGQFAERYKYFWRRKR